MKSKHTPGPWRYDKDNLNVYGNGMLAQTFGHTHNGEREANARLIAACPEMYESLKSLRALLCDPTGLPVIVGAQGDLEEIANALNILNKIEGKI